MFKKTIIFLTIILLVILSSNSHEKTKLVYNEISNDNEYNQIYLLFEDKNLTTNNFNDFFKNIKVLKVYPYINPIYAGKIKANYNYEFNWENHNYDLEKIKNDFISKLKNIGLTNEANEYQINGVVINKVLIYSNLGKIKNIFKNYNNIKYSFNLNGIYYNI